MFLTALLVLLDSAVTNAGSNHFVNREMALHARALDEIHGIPGISHSIPKYIYILVHKILQVNVIFFSHLQIFRKMLQSMSTVSSADISRTLPDLQLHSRHTPLFTWWNLQWTCWCMWLCQGLLWKILWNMRRYMMSFNTTLSIITLFHMLLSSSNII